MGGMGMGGMGGGMGMGMMYMRTLHQVEPALTDEQQDKIFDIMLDSMKANRSLMRQKAEAGKELRKVSQASESTEADIRKAVESKAKIDADLMVAHHAVKAKVMAVLTPEQLKSFEELTKDANKNWRGMRHGDKMRRGHGPAMSDGMPEDGGDNAGGRDRMRKRDMVKQIIKDELLDH